MECISISFKSAPEEIRRIFVFTQEEKKQLLELLSVKCRLNERLVTDVMIMDKFSFIEIPGSEARRVLDVLNSLSYHGRRVNAEISRPKKRKH